MLGMDELKHAWGIITHPRSVSKTMRVRQALAFYYKAALVPLIISVIIAAALGLSANTLESYYFIPAPGIPTSEYANIVNVNIVNMAVAVGFVLLYILALLPVSILVNAAIYHLFAKNLFHIWNKPYRNTMTAVLYGALPISVIPISSFVLQLFFIVPFMLSPTFFISAILFAVEILLPIALGIWGFIVLIISMARQQGVSGGLAFAVILFSMIIGIIVGIVSIITTLALGYVEMILPILSFIWLFFIGLWFSIVSFIWLFMQLLTSLSAILVAVGILLSIALGIWRFISYNLKGKAARR